MQRLFKALSAIAKTGRPVLSEKPKGNQTDSQRILLTSLVDDILVKIFGLLTVIDLISLRRTCRQLLNITKNHAVWLQQAENMVWDLHLPPFLPWEMQCEASELEQMVARRFRFQNRLRGNRPPKTIQEAVYNPESVSSSSSSSAQRTKTGSLHTKLLHYDKPGVIGAVAFLAPRWMITASDVKGSSPICSMLSLWYSGCQMNSADLGAPLACSPALGIWASQIEVEYREDLAKAVVLVFGYYKDVTILLLDLPTQPGELGRFTMATTYSFPGFFKNPTLFRDRFALFSYGHYHLILCNWREDTWVKLEGVSETPLFYASDSVQLLPNNLMVSVCPLRGTFRFFHVPDSMLVPRVWGSTVPVLDTLEPKFVLRHPLAFGILSSITGSYVSRGLFRLAIGLTHDKYLTPHQMLFTLDIDCTSEPNWNRVQQSLRGPFQFRLSRWMTGHWREVHLCLVECTPFAVTKELDSPLRKDGFYILARKMALDSSLRGGRDLVKIRYPQFWTTVAFDHVMGRIAIANEREFYLIDFV